jgi:hypothetical protein
VCGDHAVYLESSGIGGERPADADRRQKVAKLMIKFRESYRNSRAKRQVIGDGFLTMVP